MTQITPPERLVDAMPNDSAPEALHDLLSAHVGDFAAVLGDDGEFDEMANPVLTEWVIVANVVDLEGDPGDARITVMGAPHMLNSHILGLLTMAARCD